MRGEYDPVMAAYLDAWKADTPVGRALAIHYPAMHGEGPSVCAVCHFWPGHTFDHEVSSPWPCETVAALLSLSEAGRG